MQLNLFITKFLLTPALLLLFLAGCTRSPAHLRQDADTMPTGLSLAGPTSVTRGSCDAFTLSTLNRSGGTFTPPAAITVDLEANPGSFYSDTLCTKQVLRATLSKERAAAELYYYVAPSSVATSAQLSAKLADLPAIAVQREVTLNSAAMLSISDQPAYAFGYTAVGASRSRIFTLTNNGDKPASGITFSDLTPTGYLVMLVQNCTGNLAPGASCTFTVQYSPTASGVHTYPLQVAFSDGTQVATTSITLSGSGVLEPTQLGLQFVSPSPVGNCTAGTIQLKDNLSNAASSSGTIAATLSGNGSGTFYADSACSTPQSSFSIPSGTTSMPFYFKNPSAETLQFTVTDNANVLSLANLNVLITSNAILTLSDGTSYDFGTRALGGSLTHPVVVTNIGSTTATSVSSSVLAAPFSFAGGSFPGTAGDCSATLAAGATCTLVLAFTPGTSGNFSHVMNIFYHDGVAFQVSPFSLTGVGVGSPTQLSLTGPATTTTTSCATYRLSTVDGSNQLAPVLSSTTITLSGVGAGRFYSDTSCQTVITSTTFAAGVGTRQIYFRGSTPQSLTLSAAASGLTTGSLVVTVNEPASLSFASASVSYGSLILNTTSTQTLTLTNNGGTIAQSLASGSLASAFQYVGGSFPGGGTCGSSLNPSASCTVRVSFTPTTVGFASTSLTVFFDDGRSLQAAQMTLTGTGTGVPVALAIAGPVSPIIDTCIALTVSSRDASSNPAPLGSTTSITLSGMGSGSFYSDAGCTAGITSTSITSGSSSRGIYFVDSAVETLTLRAAAATFTDGTLSISTYTPAMLVLSNAPSYDFGSVPVGDTLVQTFTVTNNGGTTATALGSGSLTTPFLFVGGSFPGTSGTCLNTLAPAQSCTMRVAMSPTSLGSFASALSLIYNDGVGVQAAQIALTGLGIGAPQRIRITAPANVTADSCNAFTLRTTDTAGSDTGVIASTTITLGGAGAGSYYSDSACTAVITTRVFTTGLASMTIYFKDSTPQSLTLTATGGTMTAASQALTVQSRATLVFSDGASYKYASVYTGGTTSRSFVVTNTGQVPATAIAATALTTPFAFFGGSYPGTGGNCGTTLAAGASCALQISFSPATAVAFTDTVRLLYSDGVFLQASQVTLSALGVIPHTALQVANGFSDAVNVIVPAEDNSHVYVGGAFTAYGSNRAPGIVRLNLDMTLDSTFDPGSGANGTVNAIAPLNDGSGAFYIGGTFTTYNGTAARHLARINSNGSLDTTFDFGTGDNGSITGLAIAPLAGGGHRLYIAGTFTSVQGVGANFISRVSSAGVKDSTFVVGTGFNVGVSAIAVPSGNSPKVYAVGSFASYNGNNSTYLARINFDGSYDSTFAIGTYLQAPSPGRLYAIAVTTDGSNDIYVGGSPTNFSNVLRFTSTGALNSSFPAMSGTAVPSVRGISIATDGTQDILVGGQYGIARITPAGVFVPLSVGTANSGSGWVTNFITSPDSSGNYIAVGAFSLFNGNPINRIVKLDSTGATHTDTRQGSGLAGFTNYVTAPSGVVTSVIANNDGTERVFAVGAFSHYRGQPAGSAVSINPDASLDTKFSVGTGGGVQVNSVTQSTDGLGTMYVGGNFGSYNGTIASGIISLNSVGNVRNDFQSGGGFNNTVRTMTPQPSGTGVYIGGQFTTYDGISVGRIVRLTRTGAIDTAFAAGAGFDSDVWAIIPVGDGTTDIYVGGAFTNYKGTACSRIVRLRADGSINTSFAYGTGFSNTVSSLAVNPSNQLYAGGYFLSYQGVSIGRIARLNANGTLDTSFAVGSTGFNNAVLTMVVIPGATEMIYAGGLFTAYQGASLPYIARIATNGTRDTGFSLGLGFDGQVNSMIRCTDGTDCVVAGGAFTSYNGVTTDRIAKIRADGSLY